MQLAQKMTYYPDMRAGDGFNPLDLSAYSYPTSTTLNAAYPNPFNPSTTISYSIHKEGIVNLQVYNIQGRKVKTLVNTYQDIGSYDVMWDANGLSTGIYIVQMVSGDFVSTQKLVLIK